MNITSVPNPILLHFTECTDQKGTTQTQPPSIDSAQVQPESQSEHVRTFKLLLNQWL